MAPRLPAAFGPLQIGLRRVLRADVGRRRLLHALRRSRRARPLVERRGGARGRLPHRPDLASARSTSIARARPRAGAVLPQPALHRAALAVGDARRRGAGAGRSKDNLFHLHGGNIHTYRRMIHHMDEGIGRVHRRAATTTASSDDTLVVFTSDNGGERFSDNWPLVGGKMDLTEGGIRVPWIAHWPAVIAPAGAVTRAARHDDGLGRRPCSMPRARRAASRPIRSTACRCCRCCGDPRARLERPLYWRMNHREPARAARRRLEVPARRRARIPVRHSGRRARARQPRRAPSRAAGRRCARPGREWDATMPPIPAEAAVRLVYGKKDMP